MTKWIPCESLTPRRFLGAKSQLAVPLSREARPEIKNQSVAGRSFEVHGSDGNGCIGDAKIGIYSGRSELVASKRLRGSSDNPITAREGHNTRRDVSGIRADHSPAEPAVGPAEVLEVKIRDNW